MTKGVQWIKERTSTTLCLIRSNPVVLEGNRMAKIIIHHILSLHTTSPTKYRRPFEGRRDSFGGGVANTSYEGVQRETLPSVLQQSEKSQSVWRKRSPATTSKAIFRRYPLTGDCFDGGVWLIRMRLIWPVEGVAAYSAPNAGITFKAVPIGRCFSQFDLLKPDWMVPR